MNDRCEEKLRLLFEYRNATNLYSNRVSLMADIAAGLLPKGEFALLSKIASEAHEKCVAARERFYKRGYRRGLMLAVAPLLLITYLQVPLLFRG